MTSAATATRIDFFIVGAPKCGTTALQDYLRQAPGVFMPEGKEFHHFADDLLRPGDPLRNRDRYLAAFAGARPDQLVGETSVFHLLSTTAAANIHAFAPSARIIAMVRNPFEVLPALHAQCAYDGDEPIHDLGAALDAEPARARGDAIPSAARFAAKLLYTRAIRYAEQIERYRARFAAVHVIVHDDLKRDTPAVFRDVMAFLGQDPGFTPQFAIVNAHKQVRSRALQRVLMNAQGPAARLARLVPRSARLAARDLLRRLNTAHGRRAPLSPELRARLAPICIPEIEKLAALLGRDLSHWIEGPR